MPTKNAPTLDKLTARNKFPWTGTCTACGGDSNPYDLLGSKPSRSTVVLKGKQLMADHSERRFKRSGERVEVCYACKTRWIRNGTFARRLRLGLTKAEATKLRASCKLGWTAAEIARALDRPYSTVRGFLRDLEKAGSTRRATQS